MRFTILPFSLLVLSLSACKAHTTTKDAVLAADEPAPGSEQMPLAGGFQARDPSESDVVKAAEEAVTLLRTRDGDNSIALIRVRTAEAQVVAGMNYRLDLELTTATGTKAMRVVVYRALDGQYALTESDSIE